MDWVQDDNWKVGVVFVFLITGGNYPDFDLFFDDLFMNIEEIGLRKVKSLMNKVVEILQL